MTDAFWGYFFVFLAAAFTAWLAYLTRQTAKVIDITTESKKKVDVIRKQLNGHKKKKATKTSRGKKAAARKRPPGRRQ